MGLPSIPLSLQAFPQLCLDIQHVAATILLIRVQNIGNSPILRKDFEEPLSIRCGKDAHVLSADVGNSTPTDLRPRISFAGNTLTIEGQLLNPGDGFTSRILVENSGGKFSASARIAGVRQLETRRRTSLLQPIVSLACVAIFIGAGYFSPSPKSVAMSDLRAEEVPYLLVATLATIVLTAVFVRDLFSRIRTLTHRVRLLGVDDA